MKLIDDILYQKTPFNFKDGLYKTTITKTVENHEFSSDWFDFYYFSTITQNFSHNGIIWEREFSTKVKVIAFFYSNIAFDFFTFQRITDNITFYLF